jgi:hypothetical protein
MNSCGNNAFELVRAATLGCMILGACLCALEPLSSMAQNQQPSLTSTIPTTLSSQSLSGEGGSNQAVDEDSSPFSRSQAQGLAKAFKAE